MDSGNVQHRSRRVRAGFGQQVQDALTHLYDPIYLQVHPLTTLLVPESTPGGDPCAAGRLLRQWLLDAIESLRPGAARQTSARLSRGYEILRLRYAEGLDVLQVQQRLAIGKSQYYQDHAQAVQAVITLLEPRAQAESEADRPAWAPLAAPSGPPLPMLGLVGRAHELAGILDLLMRHDAPARLVTLTGAPGAGKTRLAQEVMAAFGPGYAVVSVRFVDLAAVPEPEPALALIAHTLGAPSLAEVSLDRAQRVLLVLDNCEQVLDIGPHLARLIGTHSSLQILATSRVAFDVYGERQFPVPPLSLPESTRDLAAVARSEAVTLFLERAQAVQPDLVLTERNALAIATICLRLDGLPLAIELAAARTRALSLEAIEMRLTDRMGLLTGGPRDRAPRQQTLRGALAWSYDLLESELQVLFRRLAVFGGSCSTSAVTAVCYAPRINAPRPSPDQVLDGLASLTAAGLLRRDVDGPYGEPRFRMLETIRDYAREQLTANGEAEHLQSRYADYFLIGPRREPGQADGRSSRLAAADEDNLRAALQAVLRETLAAGDWQGGPRQKAIALDSLGFVEFGGEDCISAERRYREALELFTALGDAAGQALVLSHLGDVARTQGNLDASRALYEQSLAMAMTEDPVESADGDGLDVSRKA